MTNLDSSQGHRNGSTYANQSVWHTTLKKERQNYTVISIDAENTFGKIQHPFTIKKKKQKPLTKLSIQGTYINIINAIYDYSYK